VNQTGFTLYYFANDAPGNGVSNCIGACAKIWLPFYAEKLTFANDLNAKDFTSQYRSDDKMQISYKGWPLYFYSKDKEPNDVYGQGVNNVWFVVNPNASMFKQPSYQPPSYPQSGYSSSGGYSSGGY
jgi:predicted lipoprotein with Yx(FWY)xxD motif